MRDGILIINKSQGMTSHDVVQLARRRLGTRHIGHAGTLDPMAQGVLILVVEGALKHQQALQTHHKQYDAVIQLGTRTDTGDAWGTPIETAPVPVLSREDVEAVLTSCVGRIRQIPPRFSAVKVHGRPLYWWARRGMPRVARARTVEVFRAELVELESTSIRCRIECSTGTYIRSLAETIAERLGTVGHVSKLTRLAVGSWEVSQARDVHWLSTAPVEELWAAVCPTEAVHADRGRLARA